MPSPHFILSQQTIPISQVTLIVVAASASSVKTQNQGPCFRCIVIDGFHEAIGNFLEFSRFIKPESRSVQGFSLTNYRQNTFGPHGVTLGIHMNIVGNETFGTNLIVVTDQAGNGIDISKPFSFLAFQFQHIIRLLKEIPFFEPLPRARNNAYHVNVSVGQGVTKLGDEIMKMCHYLLRNGTAGNIVASLIKNHRPRLKRNKQVGNEMLGGVFHRGPADPIVVNFQRI